MTFYNIKLSILVILTIGIQEMYFLKAELENHTTTSLELLNPLENLSLNENEIGDVSHNGGEHTKDTLLREKRQGYYDPYYYPTWPIPVPILIGGGGWYGGRGFGGRGFGGRGFGGGGFGGRGFGGRGFGGRGFGGGRGIGGFGGRGIGGGFGGGRGGRG